LELDLRDRYWLTERRYRRSGSRDNLVVLGPRFWRQCREGLLSVTCRPGGGVSACCGWVGRGRGEFGIDLGTANNGGLRGEGTHAGPGGAE